MLFGEHAVLYDRTAICAAIDKRVHVKLTPRQDDQIILHSNAFPSLIVSALHITHQKPYQFVLGVLKMMEEQLPSGCEIHINSDISPTIGLGSSAAVTVAMVAVMDEWLCLSLEPSHIMHRAREVVRAVQGSGSGADVAASTFGGIVAYQQHDELPLCLPGFPILHAVYCGYKTPTPQVIALIKQHYMAQPQQLEAIFDKIEHATKQAMLAIEEQDWVAVGKIMSQQYHYQRLLNVSDGTLDSIVHELQKQPGTLGVKISGSGLGDCVIALGDIPDGLFPTVALPKTTQFTTTVSVDGVLTH
jgi:mevalonate kinase